MSSRGTIRLLSYNIHQGLTILKKRQTFQILKNAIKELDFDLLLLQEVAGHHHHASHEIVDHSDPLASQLEALADEAWPFHAYGKNSLFSGGFHGNAILSRYPIVNWNNVDITVAPLQPRGCLHAELEMPGTKQRLHALAVHLGLLQAERRIQVKRLSQYLQTQVDPSEPILMAGDFNDWRELISKRFAKIHLSEAFKQRIGRHARTFPSRYPVLCLDRIYFRGVELKGSSRLSGQPWTRLSDHLPLVGEFNF
jgi:endonuclease/exonuclease/phosphatase family metal-dependent hydrolase